MIVNLLGTGSIFTSYLSSCAIIDSKIMFDCPNGAIKALRRKEIMPVNLDVLLISHFHADHYFDIPFLLLEQGLINIRTEEFLIIGPVGLKNRIDELFSMAYTESLDEIILRSKLRIIEIQDDGEEIHLKDYIIKCFQVEHGENLSYGYVITHNHKSVGFTGDSIYCSNVESIIHASDISFLDMSFEYQSHSHMGTEEIGTLMNKFPEKQIIPTHMSDRARQVFSEKYFNAPEDGAIFLIE